MILERTGVEPGSPGASRAPVVPGRRLLLWIPPDRQCRSPRGRDRRSNRGTCGFSPARRAENAAARVLAPMMRMVSAVFMKKAPSLRSGRTRLTFGLSPRSRRFEQRGRAGTATALRRLGSVDLLDLLGQGQHELVVLLLAGAGHFDLDRLILGGAAEPEALVSIIGQLAGQGSTWSSCRPW